MTFLRIHWLKLTVAASGFALFLLLLGAGAYAIFGRTAPGNPFLQFAPSRFIEAAIRRTNVDRFASYATPSQVGQVAIEPVVDPAEFRITVDPTSIAHAISPLIYGVSAAPQEYLYASGATINNWGGNTATRYNWELGNAWNAGRDWEYRNGDYGHKTGNVADNFIAATLAADAAVRLSVPTLGWVANSTDTQDCSFPLPNGECGDGYGAACNNQDIIADPTLANVPINTEFVRRWMQHIHTKYGDNVAIIAMDNEPELWGYVHYDVHPDCTTYDEILEKYLSYARVVREEMPNAELAGPTTCCWFYYWNSAAGRRDKWSHGNQDFLPWFLQQVREHDEQYGERTLDILDIHYYPPEGIYSHDLSDRISAQRIRSVRSLWDETYRDESWIRQPVYLIPRMQDLIDEHYPGTKFGLSEWNFGAEASLNGAIAIADALGVFGRENLYFATYWTYPELYTPGFYAFMLFRNYDGNGGAFGDMSVYAESADANRISSYASLDSTTGNLHVVLINKQPDIIATATVDIGTFPHADYGKIYRYSADNIDGIASAEIAVADGELTLALPTYSITHLVIPAGQ
jgi:hypothetical protein